MWRSGLAYCPRSEGRGSIPGASILPAFVTMALCRFQSMPYEAGIPGNFYPGRKLFVSGEPEDGAKKFEINLHSDKDIAFHFNPRFSEKVAKIKFSDTSVLEPQ